MLDRRHPRSAAPAPAQRPDPGRIRAPDVAAVGAVRQRADGRRGLAAHRPRRIGARRRGSADRHLGRVSGAASPPPAPRRPVRAGGGVAARLAVTFGALAHSTFVTSKRALVLAGGGIAGIAWETGILQGIADESPEAADALLAVDVLVGTSAGSTVSAQLGSGALSGGAVRAPDRCRIGRAGSRDKHRHRHRPVRESRPDAQHHQGAEAAADRCRGARHRHGRPGSPAQGHRSAAAIA